MWRPIDDNIIQYYYEREGRCHWPNKKYWAGCCGFGPSGGGNGVFVIQAEVGRSGIGIIDLVNGIGKCGTVIPGLIESESIFKTNGIHQEINHP